MRAIKILQCIRPDIGDEIIDKALMDLKQSEPAEEGSRIIYPGERTLATRRDNLENRIPVVKEIWEAIKKM